MRLASRIRTRGEKNGTLRSKTTPVKEATKIIHLNPEDRIGLNVISDALPTPIASKIT